jgi:asparagine synthase (glutamine-hydrolysing)
MCGVTGKLSTNGPVDPGLLARMSGVIEHRGPDSRGTFVEPGVGLAVQRLAIIDLETGDQPVASEDGSVVVILNGEIYNYRELRAALIAGGHRFSTHGDTEVIVHLYEDHGDACVDHLRGMFAFAVWDRRRRRLLLARDRIGKKPLVYAERNGTLWFGSEAKAILQDPDVPRDVDIDAIDCFLHYQYVPDPLSAFRALHKLPPGHVLTWEDGEIATRRYWRLEYEPKAPPAAEAETRELIRTQLLEATALRMRSDVPVGALLSGGVDSSAVVAAMVRVTDGPINTFSIGFDCEELDETPYARAVAAHLGTDHHEFRVEPHALDILPRLVWHYGEPFADSSAVPTFYLAELTRRHVKVALNGDGGDESFAGYTRYWANELVSRLGGLPPSAARLGAWAVGLVGTGSRSNTTRARLERLFHALQLPPDDRYAMWMAYFAEREREDLYTADFRAGLGERTAPEVIRGPYRASRARAVVDRLLDVDVHTYLPGDLLVKMDIAAMAHSLEVRSPLLDQDFMQTVARLPASAKVSGRVTKRILKDALRPWIPDQLLDRPKMGFVLPVREWFRGALRDVPAEVLLDARSLDRGWFREDRVRALIRDHQDGARDNSGRIWALLQLELWLRSYVDGSVAGPVALAVAERPAGRS